MNDVIVLALPRTQRKLLPCTLSHGTWGDEQLRTPAKSNGNGWIGHCGTWFTLSICAYHPHCKNTRASKCALGVMVLRGDMLVSNFHTTTTTTITTITITIIAATTATATATTPPTHPTQGCCTEYVMFAKPLRARCERSEKVCDCWPPHRRTHPTQVCCTNHCVQ